MISVAEAGSARDNPAKEARNTNFLMAYRPTTIGVNVALVGADRVENAGTLRIASPWITVQRIPAACQSLVIQRYSRCGRLPTVRSPS